MKSLKLTHYISTGLLTAMTLMAVVMYLTDLTAVQAKFEALGHPAHVVVPLAIAKLLGLTAIWTKKVKWLTEWAYAGFFFDFVLAFGAHVSIGDGEQFGALIAMVLLLVSFVSFRKLQK